MSSSTIVGRVRSTDDQCLSRRADLHRRPAGQFRVPAERRRPCRTIAVIVNEHDRDRSPGVRLRRPRAESQASPPHPSADLPLTRTSDSRKPWIPMRWSWHSSGSRLLPASAVSITSGVGLPDTRLGHPQAGPLRPLPMLPGAVSAVCLPPDTGHAGQGPGNSQPHQHATCWRATDGQRSAQALQQYVVVCVPGSVAFCSAPKTWMAGHRRAEATHFFERLCPAISQKEHKQKPRPHGRGLRFVSVN